MSRKAPAHGTEARRWGSKLRPPCTCQVCLDGSRRARKTYLVQYSRGISGHVPTAPVSAHLKKALAAGRTITHMARDTGLSPTTVRDAVAMRTPTILRGNAEKLLAVSTDKPDAYAMVDATGTVRRLRALVAMGHSNAVLAADVGCSYTYISTLTRGHRGTVTVWLEQAVRRAYAKRSMVVGDSAVSRSRAAACGWDGPLAWDEDTIDDPAALPATDAIQPVVSDGGDLAARWLAGEAVILGPKDRKEVLAHLYEWTNDTTAEIAAKLEMSPAAAERQWERIKKKAQAEGRRVWRRVYVPRNRQMKQDEMGEAA